MVFYIHIERTKKIRKSQNT